MIVPYLDGNRTRKLFSYLKYSFVYRTYTETKFNPSSSLLHGLHQPTTISSIPTRSEYDTNAQLPPKPSYSTRPTVANSILKSSTVRWPPPYEDDNRDDQYDLRASSAGIVDDVRRMVRQFHLSKIVGEIYDLFF
jgi:hypothetical protein